MVMYVPSAPTLYSREAISVRYQFESALLRLTAELRNMIFSYALGDLEIRTGRRYTGQRHNRKNCYVNYAPGHVGDSRDQRYLKNRLALTQVCRQLHEETRALPFKN
jgi:hypothetical protein